MGEWWARMLRPNLSSPVISTPTVFPRAFSWASLLTVKSPRDSHLPPAVSLKKPVSGSPVNMSTTLDIPKPRSSSSFLSALPVSIMCTLLSSMKSGLEGALAQSRVKVWVRSVTWNFLSVRLNMLLPSCLPSHSTMTSSPVLIILKPLKVVGRWLTFISSIWPGMCSMSTSTSVMPGRRMSSAAGIKVVDSKDVGVHGEALAGLVVDGDAEGLLGNLKGGKEGGGGKGELVGSGGGVGNKGDGILSILGHVQLDHELVEKDILGCVNEDPQFVGPCLEGSNWGLGDALLQMGLRAHGNVSADLKINDATNRLVLPV